MMASTKVLLGSAVVAIAILFFAILSARSWMGEAPKPVVIPPADAPALLAARAAPNPPGLGDPITQLKGVTLITPVRPLTLFGLQLVEITPEIQAIYHLDDTKGLLVLQAGPRAQRLVQSRTLTDGCVIWEVGAVKISTLADFVSNFQRIAGRQATTRTTLKNGNWLVEGDRDWVLIVYMMTVKRGWSDTEPLRLTPQNRDELMALSAGGLNGQ